MLRPGLKIVPHRPVYHADFHLTQALSQLTLSPKAVQPHKYDALPCQPQLGFLRRIMGGPQLCGVSADLSSIHWFIPDDFPEEPNRTLRKIGSGTGCLPRSLKFRSHGRKISLSSMTPYPGLWTSVMRGHTHDMVIYGDCRCRNARFRGNVDRRAQKSA